MNKLEVIYNSLISALWFNTLVTYTFTSRSLSQNPSRVLLIHALNQLGHDGLNCAAQH